MLKKLTEAFGVTGCEHDAAQIILNAIKDKCDEVKTDSIGNIIAYKKGTNSTKTIMLAVHMDEVGMIVKSITPDGYIKFDTVGGVDDRILPAQHVVVGKNRLNGVICVKPKHLISKDNKRVIKTDSMVIDIGAKDKNDAEKYVCKGDYIAFDSKLVLFGNGLVKAKSLDDRIGCSILIELMDDNYKNNIYFVFNVQEEIGCRGAKVSAFTHDVDEAIVIEATTCSDMAVDADYRFSTKLGQGVALTVVDKGAYTNMCIAKKLYTCANEYNIPLQLKQTTMGGNDASAIHISKNGINTAVLSVPCRYIHSPMSAASTADIKACKDVLLNYLKEC